MFTYFIEMGKLWKIITSFTSLPESVILVLLSPIAS